MPGERPRRAPPPAMPADLQPCLAARGLGRAPEPLIEGLSPGSRTTQGPREAGCRAQAQEPPEAQPRQATEVEPKALLRRTRAPSGPPGKAGGLAHTWLVGRADGSPPELCGLGVASSRANPTLDETPEGPQCEGPRDPEAEGPGGLGTGAHRRPSLPSAKAPPAPTERDSHRCFQETPSSFTSTGYTSLEATPGPLPPRAAHGPASQPELQASGAYAWPPAAAHHFPGTGFRASPQEPGPGPEGSRPGSPRRGPSQPPFPAQRPHGAGAKPLPADTGGHIYADGGLLFAFHQPPGTWQEVGVGTAAYPLPARPAPCTLPCYPSQPGGLDDPRDPSGALPTTGAAPLAPSPLPNTLHKSLTKVLPDGDPSARDGVGNPQGLPNPLSQRHFPGQAYGANGVGANPEPVDGELAAPGPPPTRLPHLWDPTAAPYPTPAVGPPDTTGTTFLEGQPGPDQGLCLPQSSPVPWPPVLPTPGPSPHQMETLSQLPFPRGSPEWPGDSQAGLSTACHTARPGEALAVVRSSPAQPGGSPGLFPYGALGDPGAQPLLFRGSQAQASPLGAPGLPPPRVVGTSPSESPLPSPATTTAGSSTCSSLSPLSNSPANPSPEDSQLPGSRGPPAFFHPPPHTQETGSPFPAPEPPHVLPTHYQLEPAKAFPFPTDGLGAEGPGAGRGLLQGFPREPPPYPSHHFSLSSASLDQLDVLLTCRQCDRNYGSLAGFLAHRHYCRPARAGDGFQQSPGPPAPTTAPKAPARGHTGPPSHSQTAPFPLARDDPLRTSYLPSLATPFPLAASDLDVEDEAKLDSLITEALKGMECQSDSPEIDSSFIDVFADEEPAGPRGPGPGPPTNSRPGATPEHSAEGLLPAKADTPGPQGPCPGDRSCRPRNRPQTRSLGLAPVQADATSSVKPQSRGKQFKLLRKGLDTAGGPRGPCLRPRRRGRGTVRPPPHTRDLRTQARGHPAPDSRAPSAPSLAAETRSSRHLRLPPKKDPRKRRARDGTWSKELIHKIVQQKNKLHGRLAPRSRGVPRSRGAPGPPLAPRAPRSAQDSRLREQASESEEECPRQQGAGSRGPRKGLRQDASKDRGTPGSPPGSPDPGEAAVEQRPERPPRFPANSRSPEETHPPSGFPQKGREPALAQEPAPGAPRRRGGPRPSPAACEGDSARPPAPEPPQPPASPAHLLPRQSTPAPGPVLREARPADQPGGLLRPGAAYPGPHVLPVKSADAGCDAARCDRDPAGDPPAGKESHPSSSAHRGLLLPPRDPAGCLPGGLCAQPPAAHAQGASHGHPGPDSGDTLEPKLPRHSPHAANPGSAPSPLTLESTSLFAGLPEDEFDPPLCHGQSADRDAHTPMAPADSPPEKPLVGLLSPAFSLLEEVPPVLPSQLPGLSRGKAFGRKCPRQGPAPPAPGKGSACGLSNVPEGELEIRRLVSELESQLQRTEDTQGPPWEPGKAAPAGSACPDPGPEPAATPGGTVSAPDLRGLEAAAATRAGAPGSFQRGWPCPGPCHPGEAVPLPSTHEDPGSGAPLGPLGSSARSRAEQKASVSEKEGHCRDPSGQRELLEATQPAAHSPGQELLLPRKTVGTQGTEDTPLWLPREQSGGHAPGPPQAGGCSWGSPLPGARCSPTACLAPDLAIQADGDLPPDACHSVTSEGHSEGTAGGPEGAGLLFPMTEGPGFEGKGAAPTEASPPASPQGRGPLDPPTPSPAWAPKASKKTQALASLCSQPLQVLGPRAGDKDGSQASRRALLAAACGPPHRGLPGPGGHGVESGSPGREQVTTDPAATGPQLGPQADGQLGPPDQAKKPKGCGEASWLQSVNWRKTGSPDGLSRFSAPPGHPLARPASGSPEPEGSQVPLGLGKQAQPSPGPAPSRQACSPPAPRAACSPKGRDDGVPRKVSSPGLDPQLLFNRGSPAPHAGNLGTQDPTSTAMATPAPCSLEHLPGEDPPSGPSRGPGAQGQPRGPLPEAAPCAQHPPSHPAWDRGRGAGRLQAPTGTGAGGMQARDALPPSTTSHGGPGEIPPGHPLLRARSPRDPPCCQPGLSAAPAPTHKGHGLQSGPLRAPEDSRREGRGRPPACRTPLPPGGAIPPSVVTPAAGPSSVPPADGTETVRGLWVPGLPLSRATGTCPFRVSEGPSTQPPGNTLLLGPREGDSTSAVPTTPAATEPDPPACLGGETGAGKEGEGDPGTPGVRHIGLRRVPRAGPSGPASPPPPAGLCQAQGASPNSTACDLRSGSSESQTSVSPLTPQKDPKQRPRGFKKKPEPTETGHQESHTPARPGPPVTCEICSASFRSKPGLSRHKARKHPPHKPTTPQPSPTGMPTAQACRGPRKRSHLRPGGDRPSPSVMSPGHTSGPSPVQGSTVPEDALGPETLEEARRRPAEPRTPGSPLGQLVEQGEGVRASAPKPRRPDPPEVGPLRPPQTESREGRRRAAEPLRSPSRAEGRWSETVGTRRAGRGREGSPAPASAVLGLVGRRADPATAAANHAASSPAALRPEVLEDVADPGWGVLSTEVALQSPRGQRLRRGKVEGVTKRVLPGGRPGGRRGALARRCRGSRGIGASSGCRVPELAAGSQPTEGHRGPGVGAGRDAQEGALNPPAASGAAEGKTTSSCPRGLPRAQARVRGPTGTIPDAHGPGPADPPSSLEDEVSFSQLFPLGGHCTRKKNPRVYGKRGQRPRRPPPVEPRGEGGLPGPTRLLTDLSNSGSLCLALQDPWDGEASVLPEPFLLDGLPGSKVAGLDPWAPSLSLWAPEPHREAGPGEEAPSCCAEDAGPEAIPKLRRVPAAWRGLGLRAPDSETLSLGDASPEPPDLERERYDGGLPGSASLLPLHAKDLEMLGAKLEVQDLCLLGPCGDLAGLLSPSLFDVSASANSQGPGSERTKGAAGAAGVAQVAQAGGRELPARGRRAFYKCRVCFQRVHSVGELDLHTLAHSPSPPPTCYMCVERRFCSRERLREHLQEKHLQGKAGPWACGMCLQEVADLWMYNQHLREHATRFARRGHAQHSREGLSCGLAPEGSPTHFPDSTVGPDGPHSGRPTADRAGGSLRGTSEGGREAEKEAPGERTRPEARAPSPSQDCTESHHGLASCSSPAAPTSSSATCSAKISPSPAPDPWPHSEPLLPAGPMHAACRDPSRDCHHCGKRFPKPFKLQRHLAVHSLQRVYLCPQCPGIYPEPGELRAHLGGAHGLREERELPHTLLHACQLCANVTHAIRRSFACSSCNYTFARKEQFDRHMEKHLRGGQQPLALRGVRRPATPRQKALALEGVLPNKRRKVAVPSSPPGPGVAMAWPLSQGSPTLSTGAPPTLPQLCPEAAPSTTQGWPDPGSTPAGEDQPPPHSQELLPPALSPLPTALADGSGSQRPGPTLERPEDKARPGEQQTPLEGKRASPLSSGGHRSPGTHRKGAPDGSPGDPPQLQKDRQVSTPHVAPERDRRGPAHKGGTTKPPRHRAAAGAPSKAPKPPVQPGKPMGTGSPAARERARSAEGGAEPTSPRAKSRASSQGNRCPWPGTKTGGGSQPQPASGQLQSETATTPGRPAHPGPNPTPDRPPSRSQARDCIKGLREAGGQGSRGFPSPGEMDKSREKRRKRLAEELTKREGPGSSGQAPSAPDKPLRAPRKQATPSRVLPAKPRSSSQSGKMRPAPSAQREAHSRAHRREAPGKPSLQARPPLRAPKAGRAVHGAEATKPRDHRTAESQSDLLSQLFGQRLTGFRIPLKSALGSDRRPGVAGGAGTAGPHSRGHSPSV